MNLKETKSGFRKTILKTAVAQDIETSLRAETGGKKLEQLYRGFFGSEKNCELFSKNIPLDIYLIKDLTVVDAGSSEGVLGNYIRDIFYKNGQNVKLILIDRNGVAMKKSPVKAEKIEADLIRNPLKKNSVDFVILRSVLQYVNKADQVRIMREIRRILKPKGVLISQFCSFDSQVQADSFGKIFGFAGRKVFFHGKREGIELHKRFFDKVSRPKSGPTLYESFDEFFVDRVNANESQIKNARNYIGKNRVELSSILKVFNGDSYKWKIPYTILVCRK